MSIEKYTVLQGDVADSTDLDDVVLSTPLENDLLVRNGSNQWVNSATLPAAAIAADSITYAMLQNMAGYSVLANATTGSENPSDLTAGADAILGRVGSGDLAFQKLALSQMADMSGTSKLIGSGSAGNDTVELSLGTNLSISGTTLNAAGASGDTITINGASLSGTSADFDDATPAAVGAGVNVLWQKDALDPDNVSAYVAEGAVSSALIRDSAALSVLGRASNSSGDVDDIAGTDGQALRVAGTALGFGTLASAAYAAESVTYEKLEHSVGFDVIGKATNGAGDPASIAAGDETVLGRTGGGDLGFAALATGQVSANAIEYAKWQQLAGYSIPAKATTGTGNAADLTAGADGVLGRIASADLAFSKVALSQMADLDTTSELIGSGSAGNDMVQLTLGTNLSISGTTLNAAGTSGDTITVNGSSLSGNAADFDDTTPAAVGAGVNVKWQKDALDPDNVSAYLAEGDVSNALIRDSAAYSVIGFASSGGGDVADIVAGDETVLGRTSAGDVAFGQVTTGQIATSAVTLATMADMATDSLIGRGTAATGVPEIIALDASLTMTATTLAVTDPSSASLSGYVLVDTASNDRVIADHTNRVENGDARGVHATDLQTERSNVNQVASGANAVICGGEDNRASNTRSTVCGGSTNYASGPSCGVVAGGANTAGGTASFIGAGSSNATSSDYGVISGGYDNTINGSNAADYATIGGGQLNIADHDWSVIPGGRAATTRRYGEWAFGGATEVDAQKVMGVATLKTTDAITTKMGYKTTAGAWNTTTIDDQALINFTKTGTYVISFEGTVVCMRAETSDTAGCFKISGALKKNSGGTISFIGNPKVSVVGRDDAGLDCGVSLVAGKGMNIEVNGLAGETFVWAAEYEGVEIKVPAL